MRCKLVAALTTAMLVFGMVTVANAVLMDYSLEGDFRIADRWLNDGVSELDAKRFCYTGAMVVENEGTISDRSYFSIESFDLYVPELQLAWSGSGHIVLFNHEIADGLGDGYIEIAGDNSQGESWSLFNFLRQDELYNELPNVFSAELITIGMDDGTDKTFYDGTNPTHAHDFNYSVIEKTAPVPEPATVLLLCTGFAVIGISRRKFFRLRT